ncbi:MAG: MoaD family protein [Proteobacteria bacterium]|nr:MoaD family protein [Pseudomonadota bacterium]
MGRIRVKYLNVYHDLTGKKEEFIDFEESLTLGELVERVTESSHPKFRDSILDEVKRLKPHVWILVNRAHVNDFERVLKDGDVVVFSFPPMGG